MVADSHVLSLEPGLLETCTLVDVQVKHFSRASISSTEMLAGLELLPGGKKSLKYALFLSFGSSEAKLRLFNSI